MKIVAKCIVEAVCGFVGWGESKGNFLGRSMRIRAIIDVTKLLRRSTVIKNGNKDPIRVAFKYERLCNLCYDCGSLNHQLKPATLEMK